MRAGLADDLLMVAGVALLPGTAFGPAGAGFLRLAYTQGEEDLRPGLQRMGNHLSAKVRGERRDAVSVRDVVAPQPVGDVKPHHPRFRPRGRARAQ